MLDPVIMRRGGWQLPPSSATDLVGVFLVTTIPGCVIHVHGRLSLGWDGTVTVYIKNPPRRGYYEHEMCLTYLTGDWFRLHFDRPPRSFETAIFFTEHFLRCCLAGREVA